MDEEEEGCQSHSLQPCPGDLGKKRFVVYMLMTCNGFTQDAQILRAMQEGRWYFLLPKTHRCTCQFVMTLPLSRGSKPSWATMMIVDATRITIILYGHNIP